MNTSFYGAMPMDSLPLPLPLQSKAQKSMRDWRLWNFLELSKFQNSNCWQLASTRQKLYFTANFSNNFLYVLFKGFFFLAKRKLKKRMVIKFYVNWNIHWEHISFMALFYLPTTTLVAAVAVAVAGEAAGVAVAATCATCHLLHFRIAHQGHYSLCLALWEHSKVQEQIIILTCRRVAPSSWPLAGPFASFLIMQHAQALPVARHSN